MYLLPPVNPMTFLSVLLYMGLSLILSWVIVTSVCLSDGDEPRLSTRTWYIPNRVLSLGEATELNYYYYF